MGFNYRTLANAIDEGQLTRHVREALLVAYKAGTLTGESAPEEPVAEQVDEALARRVEDAEARLAEALEAVAHERERAEALERRLEALEQQAGEPGAGQPTRAPEVEPQDGAPGTGQEADAAGSGAPEAALVSRGAHRAGVVTLEPLEGDEDALGEAAELVAEWRQLRGEEARQGSAVDRARAEERRWELELALIAEHGLALPPETEPLHPSRRDDQLRWRRVTLRRAQHQRVRTERLRLLRRLLTLGIWRR